MPFPIVKKWTALHWEKNEIESNNTIQKLFMFEI